IKINGDKELLLIVLRNLIQNAIQAIGTKNGKIFIDFSEDEDWSIVKIVDDGPGIPEKIMNDIFEPLYTTKQEGTGLGLVTCKTVVEQHGGVIEVENNPDVGVTFTVKIPKRLDKLE
ncbi:MAG: HAMP domain-containing sensor histidine kinase, partial [Nitrosopumilaceae archaeon]|nr:HAMP domain-containing sensor histidine kinase [Nitrosopumilaceae archaeon]